ncbi:MAG: hypothetical protein KJI71_00620 [Patescibacteria group bacterium]|nr:hypothetical protein [Patescibacteria group bacterium]
MSEKSKDPIVKVQCNKYGILIPTDEFPEEGLFVCSKCLGRIEMIWILKKSLKDF